MRKKFYIRVNQSSGLQEIRGQVSAVQVFHLPSCESPGSIICLFRSMSATFLVGILFSGFFPGLNGRIGSGLPAQFLVECLWFTVLDKSNFV